MMMMKERAGRDGTWSTVATSCHLEGGRPDHAASRLRNSEVWGLGSSDDIEESAGGQGLQCYYSYDVWGLDASRTEQKVFERNRNRPTNTIITP